MNLSPSSKPQFKTKVDDHIYHHFLPIRDLEYNFNGHYVALFRGPFLPSILEDLPDSDVQFLMTYKFGVLHQDDQGFVTTKEFPTYKEALTYYNSLLESL